MLNDDRVGVAEVKEGKRHGRYREYYENGMDGKLDLPDSKDKWDARYYHTHPHSA